MADVKLSVPRDFRGPFVAELVRSSREAQRQGRHVDVLMHAGDGGQVSLHKVTLLHCLHLATPAPSAPPM